MRLLSIDDRYTTVLIDVFPSALIKNFDIVMSLTINSNWPQRKEYGSGTAIRTVMITTPEPGCIALAMEDMAHAFQIHLHHDGTRVTDLQAQWIRHPLTSCVGAEEALKKLIGCPLNDDLLSVSRFTDYRQQCTHMFDMIALATVHAFQRRSDRRYDVIVPDEVTGQVHAQLKINGQEVMLLKLQDYDMILLPEMFSGRSVFRGFLKWAKENLTKTQVEYCFLLQKGLFVARGQLIDIEACVGEPAELTGPPMATCYGSQELRYKGGVRTNQIRRFDESAEEHVLNFLMRRITSNTDHIFSKES